MKKFIFKIVTFNIMTILINVILSVVGLILMVWGLILRRRLKKNYSKWQEQQFPYNMGKIPNRYWWMLLIGFLLLLFGLMVPFWAT